MPSPTCPSEPSVCDCCGAHIDPQRTLGLCPKCLLITAIEQIEPDDHPAFQGQQQAGRCPTITELGKQVVGFEFHELLGRGGSSWTFLATQENLSRQVAVKVIRRKAGLRDSVKQFRTEAESLARLNHPRIVTVHDSGVTEDFLYLVMEYVAGPTLRQRIQVKRMTVSQTLRVAQEICEAVQSAHAAGIAHRDIKPENILFASDADDAQIKVADFGIARLLDIDREHKATAGGATTGMIAGTPFYMAPEQSEHQPMIAHQCDVYSIGVVVYEMLTGRLPLGRFPRPSSLSGCSTIVDRAVFNALQNQPEQRTATVEALANDLGATESITRWQMAIAAIVLSTLLAIAICYWPTPNAPSEAIAPAADVGSTIDTENPFLKDWSDELSDRPSDSETK